MGKSGWTSWKSQEKLLLQTGVVGAGNPDSPRAAPAASSSPTSSLIETVLMLMRTTWRAALAVWALGALAGAAACDSTFSWDISVLPQDYGIAPDVLRNILVPSLQGPNHTYAHFQETLTGLCPGQYQFQLKWSVNHAPTGYPLPPIEFSIKENDRDITVKNPKMYHVLRQVEFTLHGPDLPASDVRESPVGEVQCFTSILINFDKIVKNQVYWYLRGPWFPKFVQARSLHYMCDGLYRFHIEPKKDTYGGDHFEIDISVNDTKLNFKDRLFEGKGMTKEFSFISGSIQIRKEVFSDKDDSDDSPLPQDGLKDGNPLPWIFVTVGGGLVIIGIGAWIVKNGSTGKIRYGRLSMEEGIEMRM